MKQRSLLIAALLPVLVIILTVIFLQIKQENSNENIVTTAVPNTEATYPKLPDSALYYGEIQKIKTGEDGAPSQLILDSEPYGPYIMNLSDSTCYVDSGRGTILDAESFQAGDRVYVFHSPISAQSMPPQSAAFAVLKNIPMDASCAMYHESEQIQKTEDGLLITTDNGSKVLGITADTQITACSGETQDMDQIREGSFVLAWYWDQGEPVMRVSRLMLLP